MAIVVAGAAAIFVGGWAFGHASPSSPWARAGVRAVLPRIDPPEEPSALSLEANPADPGSDAAVAADDEADTEAEGDSVSDLLAEAAAHARLARANDAGSGAPGASASAAPAPSAPLGSATRMRHVAEQIIVTCRSGHADDVRVLADALLQQHPPAWLAQRVRAACHIEEDPPPP